MTVYKICEKYDEVGNKKYYVMPYDVWGTLKCCGIKFFFHRCYLTEKQAEKKRKKLKRKWAVTHGIIPY